MNLEPINYFCTIHPWMEAIVNVKAAPSNIPPYAVDQNGIDDWKISYI